jgi:hypothetical protein
MLTKSTNNNNNNHNYNQVNINMDINQLVNSTNSNNRHLINQNFLRKDILGLNTERQNVTPIKLIDNKRFIDYNTNDFKSE